MPETFCYHGGLTSTEMKLSSFWRNFHHWLYRKLSKWQLSLQLVTKFSSPVWGCRCCSNYIFILDWTPGFNGLGKTARETIKFGDLVRIMKMLDGISIEWTNFTNPRMHLFHIPQCSIQNRNVHISVLNGALWDMKQVHSGICELGQLDRYRLDREEWKRGIICVP